MLLNQSPLLFSLLTELGDKSKWDSCPILVLFCSAKDVAKAFKLNFVCSTCRQNSALGNVGVNLALLGWIVECGVKDCPCASVPVALSESQP